MPQCHYQLMLIPLCFHWLLTRLIFITNEKKPTADSQHSAPFFDYFMDFFSHKCKLCHKSPWANTFFSFRRKKERESRQSKQLLLVLYGDSYEGVGLGVWAWVGVRVSVWDMKWSYDNEPISVTRAIIMLHEDDLQIIWKGLSQIPQGPDASIPKPDTV